MGSDMFHGFGNWQGAGPLMLPAMTQWTILVRDFQH